jgi:4-alpha-glucanotransferase
MVSERWGSPSAIALNYYFIDLDTLAHEGLLTEKEILKEDFGSDPLKIDYGKLFYHRIPLLKKAFSRFDREDPDFVRFEKEGTTVILPSS